MRDSRGTLAGAYTEYYIALYLRISLCEILFCFKCRYGGRTISFLFPHCNMICEMFSEDLIVLSNCAKWLIIEQLNDVFPCEFPGSTRAWQQQQQHGLDTTWP